MYFRVVACFVVLLSCTAFSAGQCKSSQNFVETVSFTDTSQLPRDQQQSVRMSLVGKCFDEQHVDELADAALDVVHSFGFFRAQIARPTIEKLDATDSPQARAVTLDVMTGRKFYLGSLNCVGMDWKPAAQLCSSSLVAGENGVLDTSKVLELMKALHRLYFAAGSTGAAIERRVKTDGSRADVWITVIQQAKP